METSNKGGTSTCRGDADSPGSGGASPSCADKRVAFGLTPKVLNEAEVKGGSVSFESLRNHKKNQVIAVVD